jgi:glucokinase
MVHVVAADLGGTQIKSGLVTLDGGLSAATSTPTDRANGWQAVVAALLDVVSARVADCAETTGRPPAAVGVVVPGLVDDDAGIARRSTNLGWHDVPLRDLLVERTGLPVVISHDVRAGGLAEARIGAGRGAVSTLFVPLGTGIAAAHVVDGHQHAGAHWGAGELGHVVVNPTGPRCACGRTGCLEAIASASAIERRYADTTGTAGVTAEQVADLVRAGQPAALQIWGDAIEALATALTMATMLLDPEVIVIGGGLSRAGTTLLDPLRTAMAGRFTFRDAPDVVGAQLGEWAGCRGAGLLAADHLASERTPEAGLA